MVSFSVDGNFHLSRNSKGGGPLKDPSLFCDWGFWAADRALCERYLKFHESKKNKPVRSFGFSSIRHPLTIISALD